MTFASLRLRRHTGIRPDARAATALWAAAVVVNGGTVSLLRVEQIAALIGRYIAAGAWDLLDDAVLLCAENAQQALTSLKQRRLATVVAAPTFTIDRGYAFNGTTQYVNTGFIPSTHSTAMTGANQRGAVYERTEAATTTAALGGRNSNGQQIYISPRQSGSLSAVGLNGANVNHTLPAATSLGFSAFSRAGGGVAINGWKNGTIMTAVNAASAGTNLPTHAIYLWARNAVGTADLFRGATGGHAEWGAPLTTGQEASVYTALQAHMTAIGAQV